MSGGGEDFSEDITNGGFANDDTMGNTGEECDMMAGGDHDGDMNQDDSMQETGEGSNNQNEHGEAGHGSNGDSMMEQQTNSNDTGSADQYGKDDDRYGLMFLIFDLVRCGNMMFAKKKRTI